MSIRGLNSLDNSSQGYFAYPCMAQPTIIISVVFTWAHLSILPSSARHNTCSPLSFSPPIELSAENALTKLVKLRTDGDSNCPAAGRQT